MPDKLQARPITLREAAAFTRRYHRHYDPRSVGKGAIAATLGGKTVGVALAGRPTARHLDDGKTLEVVRVCTDGTKNANSFLYSRCKRIALLMGYERVITYTLLEESGSSLHAVGARITAEVDAREWDQPGRRRRSQSVYMEPKLRWEL